MKPDATALLVMDIQMGILSRLPDKGMGLLQAK